MRAYAYEPTFWVTEAFTLCVEPDKLFSVAVFRQDADQALTMAGLSTLVASTNVTKKGIGPQGRFIYRSGSSPSPQSFSADWQWPSLVLKLASSVPKNSANYPIVVYEVDERGYATEDIGRKVERGDAVYPYPPDSDSMALLIGSPRTPQQRIAYIVPVATYHAYNWTGGGCFYDNHPKGTRASKLVTMRRPGGGLGAELGEPPDFYDTMSPRQQFGHWDARFVRWMMAAGIGFDVYSDLDLHSSQLDRWSRYKLILSVGHHEYWSASMRGHLGDFLSGGGNYASFSGNTCFRPINFGEYRTSGFMNSVQKLANYWAGPPLYSETQLIGLSYGWGGGKWGHWTGSAWDQLERVNYGYAVAQSDHWVFAGTGLTNGQTFGNGANDFLVGYEADGMPPTGSTFTLLAKSPKLEGFTPGNEGGGTEVLTASLGVLGQDSGGPVKNGMVFNAGTTDWARVLTDSTAASRSTVDQITRNVINTLSRESA